jgi:branched-subunit amino acid transport protein AzlD
MTPIAGFVIAMVAGLLVSNGRWAAKVVLVPWLVVLAYQSWYIAAGRAISPPSTVTQFPSAIGYWLVQVIILAPALGIAAQLGTSGKLRNPLSATTLARRAWMASTLGVVATVIVIMLGFVLFRHQGGTAFVTHHSANGSPPLVGVLGLLLSFGTCAALGVMTFIRRHSLKGKRSARPRLVAADAEASR